MTLRKVFAVGMACVAAAATFLYSQGHLNIMKVRLADAGPADGPYAVSASGHEEATGPLLLACEQNTEGANTST